MYMKCVTQDIPNTLSKLQAELVQTRKERNTTIKQLNEIIVKMAENVRYSLPQAVSSDPTTKVFLSQHMYCLYVHYFYRPYLMP